MCGEALPPGLMKPVLPAHRGGCLGHDDGVPGATSPLCLNTHLGKTGCLLEGPGEPLATVCSNGPDVPGHPPSTLPDPHSPSLQLSWVCVQRAQLEGSGGWGRAQGAGVGGHRDPGAQEGNLAASK